MSKPSGFSTYDIMDYEHGGGSFGPAKERVSMAYTAEDFERELEHVKTFSKWSEAVKPSEVILAALPIAANVMDDEKLYAAWLAGNAAEWPDKVAAIRKALTDG